AIALRPAHLRAGRPGPPAAGQPRAARLAGGGRRLDGSPPAAPGRPARLPRLVPGRLLPGGRGGAAAPPPDPAPPPRGRPPRPAPAATTRTSSRCVESRAWRGGSWSGWWGRSTTTRS